MTPKRKRLAVFVAEGGPIEDQLPDLKQAALEGQQALDRWYVNNFPYQVLQGQPVPSWLTAYFEVPDYAWRLGSSPPNG